MLLKIILKYIVFRYQYIQITAQTVINIIYEGISENRNMYRPQYTYKCNYI